jgi:ATP-dependent DNA helicase RecG
LANINGKITNSEYLKLNTATQKTAARNLVALVGKSIFSQIGTTGRGTYYILKEAKGT